MNLRLELVRGGAKNKKGCQMKIKYSFLSVAFVHLTPHHNQIIKSPLRSEVKIIYVFKSFFDLSNLEVLLGLK